ncbi:hypothetical protein HMPREF7215_1957 [Pyramidobacter piscolens W5455]|uniref:Uncharacterized protein n=1 Tax=Pyramidobacter piscolens W5455 TaxID=352165 RepID=A0ABP2HWX5_9BACT|nr:hypothetical protein HMPREF7215_1957 [Pyramidobacter piscolens W5455]
MFGFLIKKQSQAPLCGLRHSVWRFSLYIVFSLFQTGDFRRETICQETF